MSIPSIIVGEGNWAGKSGNLLGYAVSDVKIVPREFTVSRALNTATRVNVSGNIEGVNANIPRIDYFGGQASLLVEPSGTNLCLRSQDIDLWTPTFAIVTPNVAISPNGMQNAELFVPNSSSNGRTEINIGTLTNATTYTITCFMKQHTASLDQVTLYVSDGGNATGSNRWGVNVSLSAFTLSNYAQGNGSVTSTSIENYGNGWYRIRVTGQVTSGMTSTSSVVIRYFGSTANGTNGVLVFGAQFELGSVATSYIPTTTGTVTRNADVISVTGVAGLIGQTEGTIYLEMQADAAGTGTAILTLGGTSSDNYLYIGKDSNKMRVRVRIGGAEPFNNGDTVLNGSVLKIAVAYQQSGNCAAYVNGNFLVSGTAANNFSAALTGLGFSDQVTFPMTTISAINRIRAASIYQTRLPNTTTDGSPSLQSITTL